jgi:hypothetical protein
MKWLRCFEKYGPRAISENGDCFKRQIDRIPTS